MEFLRWYVRGIWRLIRSILKIRLHTLLSPAVEYSGGVLLLVAGSLVLPILVSPWWLFLLIPVGATVIVHSAYRQYKRYG